MVVQEGGETIEVCKLEKKDIFIVAYFQDSSGRGKNDLSLNSSLNRPSPPALIAIGKQQGNNRERERSASSQPSPMVPHDSVSSSILDPSSFLAPVMDSSNKSEPDFEIVETNLNMKVEDDDDDEDDGLDDGRYSLGGYFPAASMLV